MRRCGDLFFPGEMVLYHYPVDMVMPLVRADSLKMVKSLLYCIYLAHVTNYFIELWKHWRFLYFFSWNLVKNIDYLVFMNEQCFSCLLFFMIFVVRWNRTFGLVWRVACCMERGQRMQEARFTTKLVLIFKLDSEEWRIASPTFFQT